MLVQLLELSWWFYIHEKKQLHEVIYISSETSNRHRISSSGFSLKKGDSQVSIIDCSICPIPRLGDIARIRSHLPTS
jgi:hypothetical protein